MAKAARTCMDHDINPKEYISALHQFIEPPLKFYPNMLNCTDALSYVFRYRQLQSEKKFEDSHEGNYEQMGRWLCETLKLKSITTAEILIDPEREYLAWFRVLITMEPDLQIIAKYGDEAKQQIETDPTLKTFLIEKGLDIKRLENICPLQKEISTTHQSLQ